MKNETNSSSSRRNFLKLIMAGGAAIGTGAVLQGARPAAQPHVDTAQERTATPMPAGMHPAGQGGHGDLPGTVGEVDHERNGFNPTDTLTDFDYGKVSKLPNGQ